MRSMVPMIVLLNGHNRGEKTSLDGFTVEESSLDIDNLHQISNALEEVRTSFQILT